MSFITQACVNKYMIFSCQVWPGVGLIYPLSACGDDGIVRQPASRLKTKRGSRLLAAGEYVDRGRERKKRIWRSNALQWEDVKRSLADVSLQPQLGLRLFLLLTNSILSCRSLLSCHVAVVSSASAQRGQYGEVREVTPGVNTNNR